MEANEHPCSQMESGYGSQYVVPEPPEERREDHDLGSAAESAEKSDEGCVARIRAEAHCAFSIGRTKAIFTTVLPQAEMRRLWIHACRKREREFAARARTLTEPGFRRPATPLVPNCGGAMRHQPVLVPDEI